MYLPAQFEETRIEVLHALIGTHALATLVVHGADGLLANHIPMRVSAAPAPFGVLRGHGGSSNADGPIPALTVPQFPVAG